MKKFLILIFFYLSISINYSMANEKIVFIDVDRVIYESNLGKKIAKQMDGDYKKEDDKLKKTEENLKKKEANIVKQKNILSEEELNKKIKDLQVEINQFKGEKNSLMNKFQQQKLKKINIMVESLNKILSKYASSESIDIIVQKKNIVIGKSELDITDEILEIFNKEVTSLKN